MIRKRGKGGEFVETITFDAVLAVFDDVEGPIVTSADVADALDCSRDAARRKLGQLHDQGRVGRRKTAGRVVWWLADDEPVTETEIDPDDPLFTGDAVMSVDLGDESIDDVLYEPVETDGGDGETARGA